MPISAPIQVGKALLLGAIANVGVLLAAFLGALPFPEGPTFVIAVIDWPVYSLVELAYPRLYAVGDVTGVVVALAVVIVNGGLYGLVIHATVQALAGRRRR